MSAQQRRVERVTLSITGVFLARALRDLADRNGVASIKEAGLGLEGLTAEQLEAIADQRAFLMRDGEGGLGYEVHFLDLCASCGGKLEGKEAP